MTLIIGHRGAKGESPENTIDSFIHAAAQGCHAFELDVRLTKDKQLVVFHDLLLGRCTTARGLLSELTLKQLQTLDARQPLMWHKRAVIPSLKDVIAAVPNTIDWQFEVKPTNWLAAREIAIKLSNLLNSCHAPSGRVTVTSSSPLFLDTLANYSPNTRRGLVEELSFERGLKKCINMKLELLALKNTLCSNEAANIAKASNIELSVWTVNSFDRITQLEKIGVDSIITDFPSKAIVGT